MTEQGSVLLLGIGNVLWADEGFGVRAIEYLQKNYHFPEHVQVLDGGTQGMYLVQHVQQAEVLVIFDAVDFGLAPGSLHCLEDDDVPNFLGAKKMSLHQTGFQEVLAMAQMLGQYPEKILLIGVQPEELEDFGGSLRDKVKAQICPAVEYAISFLRQFAIEAQPVVVDSEPVDPVLNILRYEQERPSEEVAWRRGDARVVASDKFILRPPSGISDDMLSVDVDYRGKY